MQVKGPTKVKGPKEVNLKHGGGNFFSLAPFANFPCSPTLKMILPPLNVVGLH